LDLNSKEASRINMPGGRDYLYTEWSPLGNIIAYNSYYNGMADICTINLDGSNENCLTTDQNFDVGGPRFSPDGSKIVYFSHIHDSYDIGDIWVIDSNGENKIQLTNDRDYQSGPSWSPDGKRITYSSGSWPNAHIWVMNADGTNKVQLTSGSGFEGEPSWSPDGKFTFAPNGYLFKNRDRIQHFGSSHDNKPRTKNRI
jgi:Tol biopolymer transport system component